MNSPRIAWFYIREVRGSIRTPSFIEMHRIGCVAMFKKDDGKLQVTFSLATNGDRFVRKIGRDIALGRLSAQTRIHEIETPNGIDDLIRKIPDLYRALVRRTGTTLMPEKNDACLAGALKELELVKAK
jgi:hypothetical protein